MTEFRRPSRQLERRRRRHHNNISSKKEKFLNNQEEDTRDENAGKDGIPAVWLASFGRGASQEAAADTFLGQFRKFYAGYYTKAKNLLFETFSAV